jgi:hypothetical protein
MLVVRMPFDHMLGREDEVEDAQKSATRSCARASSRGGEQDVGGASNGCAGVGVVARRPARRQQTTTVADDAGLVDLGTAPRRHCDSQGTPRGIKVMSRPPHGPAGPRGTTGHSVAGAVWQVQDSNLRRHTPTDLQNADAHAVTCGFTTSATNLGTTSARTCPELELAAGAVALPIRTDRRWHAIFARRSTSLRPASGASLARGQQV